MQTSEHPCYNKLLCKVGHRSRVYADGRQHYCERCGEKIDQTTFSNIPQDYVTTHDAGDYNKPRPSAPVDGLETVAWRFRHSEQEKWHYDAGPQNWWEKQELVTRSQTEAIIAARDAEIERLQKINALVMGDDENAPRYTTKRLKQEVERVTQVMRGEAADREAHVKTLQANNAALAARVKEQQEEIASLANSLDGSEHCRKTLETQLAAAKKALEPFAKDADKAEKLNPNNNIGGFTTARVRDLRIARAALEAKP